MALSTSIDFSFRDQKNKTSSTSVAIPATVSIPNAVAFAEDMAQLMANMTTGQITDATLSFKLEMAGLNQIASTFSSVGEKALFQFRSAVAGFFRKYFIPTWDETLTVIAGTDQIDTSNTDVAALIASIEDGIELADETVVQEVDKYGNDLESLSFAREVFRRHK